MEITSGDIEAILTGHFMYDRSFREKNVKHPVYLTGRDNLQAVGTLCRVKFYHLEDSINPIAMIEAGPDRVSLESEEEGEEVHPLQAKFRTNPKEDAVLPP